MLQVTDLRLAFVAQRDQFVRQRQWLIDLDRLLDPVEPPASGLAVAQQVQAYLEHLQVSQATIGDAWDRQVADHIVQTFRNRWWGLFACYDVVGLPRTKDELETLLGRLKTWSKNWREASSLPSRPAYLSGRFRNTLVDGLCTFSVNL